MEHETYPVDGRDRLMKQQRNTRQLTAIKEAIESAGRPLSIEEIQQMAAKSVETLGQRTVYRAVRRLEDDGLIARVNDPGGGERYELASVAAHHHHHFHCTKCDRFYDVHGCPGGLQNLLPEGFVLEHHELMLSGCCAACVP